MTVSGENIQHTIGGTCFTTIYYYPGHTQKKKPTAVFPSHFRVLTLKGMGGRGLEGGKKLVLKIKEEHVGKNYGLKIGKNTRKFTAKVIEYYRAVQQHASFSGTQTTEKSSQQK